MQNRNPLLMKLCRLLLLLGIVASMMSFSLPAFAAEGGSCGPKLKWELSGDTLTISGSGNMTNFKDDELAPWYDSAEHIRIVNLPSGLTSIGDLAFYGCTNLTSINIPDKVTSIGEYAFAECTSLTQVKLGTGVQIIEKGAFYHCESLTSISFPESLTSVGNKAFYRCNSLSYVTVPSTVTSMGTEVFAYCEGIVRATINASLTKLPDWTFYGCSNLTDVSLAPSISKVGGYAFEQCENLNGIYTQSGSTSTAYQIEQSIKNSDTSNTSGFVASYDIPETSVVTKEEDNVYTEIKVTQTGDSVVTEKSITDFSNETEKPKIIIEATVNNSGDWKKTVEIVENAINRENFNSITVDIQLAGETVEAADIALFAGKNVTLRLITISGTIWKLDMSELSEKDFSGIYNLGVSLIENEKAKKKIASETVYQMKFADRIKFNVTVGVKVGYPYGLATLYEKKGRSYEIIKTMIIDNDNYAWFSLAGVDKSAKYYIGLDVEGLTIEDAIVPQTMYKQYDLDENDAYLMDENGMQYRITGRSSRWGITGKQFAIYVGVAIAAMVLIVGFVMITLNIIKKSKEKYERMAEEEALKEQAEEEALRMEIMKELLGENDDSIKKE